jgi:eukaryotic-like serine/threonine-protein kinase
MDVKTWTTVSRLLDDALDLPPGARADWLDCLGAEHDAVKPRLRELLAQAASMDRELFLATLPKLGEAANAAPDHDADGTEGATSRIGARVGPYTLVRPIASGGQGAVWLAERTDGVLTRPVALKLPHGLAFRPGLAERMARERDILATLTHPHIARLYDAGVTAEGEPYLALEYVDGTAIDAHAKARDLSIPARVRLFLQVVRAVAFAHGQLVIHRDLKPSNILVTPEGYVRLLDFGIAKLLVEEALDSTLTVEAGRALTLAYASPEQVAQRPLGVASDVYSLGVVLFELLTGARPYRLERESAALLEEAVLTQEPRRASDGATDRATKRALAGDIDTILAKTLKKDPMARYASADTLADDLERCLDGRPVLAQPDSRSYRLRKFVRRHAVGVAASAAVLLAIVAGAGVAVWQAQVARAERDAARVQQDRSDASNGFLQSLLQQASPDRPLTATELLDRGTKQLDQAEGVDESTLAFLRYSISTHYLRFNQTDRELALLTQSAAGARQAGDYDLLAAVECSASWSVAFRDVAEATAHLTNGEQALARVTVPSFDAQTDCLRARSRVLDLQGRAVDAIRLLEEHLPRLPPPPAAAWAELALVKTQLGGLYARVERFSESLQMAEEHLADVRRRGQAGTLNEFGALNNVATYLARVGEVRSALAIYTDLLTWLERGVFAVEPVALRANVGTNEARVGNAARALQLADGERASAERAGSPFNVALANLLAARAHLALGQSSDARARLDAAEATFKKNERGNARLLVETGLIGADILAAERHVSDARRSVASILASLGYPAGKTAPGLDRALRLSARLSMVDGDPARALEHASDALGISRRIARDERHSADVGEAALLRAQALHALGRPADALGDATLAADALGYGLGPDHATTKAAAVLVAALSAPTALPR